MNFTSKFFTLMIFFAFTITLTLNSCGNKNPDEMEIDPCEEIEKLQEKVIFNNKTYQLSNPRYSDNIIDNYKFIFEGVNEDCSETVKFNLDFHREFVIVPDNPLNGVYKFVFVDSILKLKNFQVSGWYGFKRILSGTATIKENNDGTLTIKIDAVAQNQTAINLELTYKFF